MVQRESRKPLHFWLFFRSLLVLLCQKRVRRVMRWQHGQRGRMRLMVRAIAMRTDVIEFGT